MLKTVGEDCKGLKLFSPHVKIDKESKQFKIHQTIHFFNDVVYRGHNLHIIEFDENAEKKPSKRFAKIQSKQTHWEWIGHQKLNHENISRSATKSRIRWWQEDLFNDFNPNH